MKNVFVLVLVLMLCAMAMAEGMTPAAYLASRGLMVLDENQIAAMGGESSDSPDLNGLSYFLLSTVGENSPPIFAFNDGHIMYIAMEMGAMFGSPTMDGKALSQVFIEMCEMFDFDVYGFGSGDSTSFGYVYGDMDKLMEVADVNDGALHDTKICQTKDEFFDTLLDFVG